MQLVPILQLDHVTKAYNEGTHTKAVLREVSMTLALGEIVVLMGKSGSGKSTLLNLVSGIDAPTSGEVRLDNQPFSTLTEHNRTLVRRRRIGFVFQFFNLVPTLTVVENVRLPLELNGVGKHEAQPRALAMLEQVGLADRGASYPDRLSGGEQQRVAIARALVHDPALVLADEPTGNLDSDTSRQVLELLDTLTRQAGKSMLMVTHSVDALELADRAFRLREGVLHNEPVSADTRN